jgi:hypothetical protein
METRPYGSKASKWSHIKILLQIGKYSGQIQSETVKVLDSLKIAKFEGFTLDRDQAGMTRYKHRKIDVAK